MFKYVYIDITCTDFSPLDGTCMPQFWSYVVSFMSLNHLDVFWCLQCNHDHLDDNNNSSACMPAWQRTTSTDNAATTMMTTVDSASTPAWQQQCTLVHDHLDDPAPAYWYGCGLHLLLVHVTYTYILCIWLWIEDWNQDTDQALVIRYKIWC